MSEWPGHAVLQVPIPVFEPVVRARYAHYDPTLLAADPTHVHAHITVLGPVPASPSPHQREALTEVATGMHPLPVTFSRIDVFPQGVVHAPPDDPAPWLDLTRRVRAIFPEHPPYGGEFVPGPHVTIDALGPEVTLASVQAELAPLLPAHDEADRLELVWYRAGEVRVLATWPFGGPVSTHPAPTPAHPTH